ncbi:MAG TPA: ParB/RepB/Spo0J family partition protein [Thermodesulfobacteriota bacterium]
MTTVAVQPLAGVQAIPLALIDESPTNPRKTFRHLEELAADVAQRGILQPVLCRPKGDRYELVFGARRYRAAKLAGLAEIPAMVREMTDQEVLETQLVENAKRDDIHPLEEAEALEALHTRHGLSVDDLAVKVGKSKATVYARLKLCALVPAARKAFLAEQLSPSVALLVARVPQGLQGEVLKRLEQWRRGDDEPISHRQAFDLISREFMLRLSEAPFPTTDADLVPTAGSCAACPKRTGNQRELFSDVKSADVCTDPICFRTKADAAWARRVAEAKAAGQTVLSDKEAKKVFPYNHGHLAYDSGYVDLDAEDYQDPKHRTFKQLLGKHAPTPVLVRDPEGRVRELILKKDLPKAMKAAGRERPKASTATTRKPTADEAKKEALAKLRAVVQTRALEAIVKKAEAKEPTPAFWRFLVLRVADAVGIGFLPELLERRGVKLDKKSWTAKEKAVEGYVSKASAATCRGLVVELLAGDDEPDKWRPEYSTGLKAAADLYGVDLAKLEKAVAAEQAKATPAKEPKAKGSKKRQTAPTGAKHHGARTEALEDDADAAAVEEEWADTAAAVGGDPRDEDFDDDEAEA